MQLVYGLAINEIAQSRFRRPLWKHQRFVGLPPTRWWRSYQAKHLNRIVNGCRASAKPFRVPVIARLTPWAQ